jgi:hypothetical protein
MSFALDFMIENFTNYTLELLEGATIQPYFKSSWNYGVIICKSHLRASREDPKNPVIILVMKMILFKSKNVHKD